VSGFSVDILSEDTLDLRRARWRAVAVAGERRHRRVSRIGGSDSTHEQTMTINSFEFVVLASLRVRQLVDGCTPRVVGDGKTTTIARREVLAGKVPRIDTPIPPRASNDA
jgi:DNA-directed RNA polymerase subunit K/omega